MGLPACGKSTFAFKLKKVFKLNFQKKVKIIDPDIIRNKTFQRSFNFRDEPQIREKNLKLVKRYLNKGYIVISDDLNYYSSMRHDLKIIADSLNIKFYIIHISTALKLCLKRNRERGKPIPDEVIINIYNKFDTFNKYKWDTPFETYDSTLIPDIFQFLEILSIKIKKDLQEQKNSKELIQKKLTISIREGLDLITRKYVGELLKNPNYRSSKKAILEYRKLFIKSRSDIEFDAKRVLDDFKLYLDKNLKV